MTVGPWRTPQTSDYTPDQPSDTGGITDEEALRLLGLGGTQSNGQFVTLPDGRFVLIDPKTGRIIQDYGMRASAAAGATHGQLLSHQTDLAQLAEQQRQYDETFGLNKARFDIEQQFTQAQQQWKQATDARDYAAAQHWQQVATDLQRQRLQLDQQAQAFNQYKSLADLASNPRNFVQTFFMNRGYQPPADVARYGNIPQTAADIIPFQQFLTRQQDQVRPQASLQAAAPNAGGYVGQGNQPPVGRFAPAPTQAIGPSGGYSFAQPIERPGATGEIPTNAQIAFVPGGGAPSGQGTTRATDLYNTPISLSEFGVSQVNKKPRTYGQGGALRMTAPHALVNLITGQVAAIAGERGPETARFDGAAIIDPSLEGTFYDPYQGQPTYSPTGSYTVNPPQTVNPYNNSNPYSGSDVNYQYPVPGVIQPSAAPTLSDADRQAALDYLAQLNAQQQAPAPTTTAPDNYEQQPYTGYLPTQPAIIPTITQQQQPIDYSSLLYRQGGTWQGGGADTIGGAVTGGGTTTGNLPIIGGAVSGQGPTVPPGTTPGGATPINIPPPTTTNPQNASTPGSTAPTFGQPIPAQMPTFLAGEDFQAQSPVIREFQRSQALPPFLRRLYGQARGEQQYGTNVPQRTDLPPDLPLVSRLAWEQMSPSEQQGFLSIVSSLGVTPEDYLALVYGSSPQGPSAQAPVFGSPLSYYRQ